jgi:hypothetical protein
MLQRTGPGAGPRKNLALADLVRGRARNVSAALGTARVAKHHRIPSQKASATHQRFCEPNEGAGSQPLLAK